MAGKVSVRSRCHGCNGNADHVSDRIHKVKQVEISSFQSAVKIGGTIGESVCWCLAKKLLLVSLIACHFFYFSCDGCSHHNLI